jgi:hypothetical protein
VEGARHVRAHVLTPDDQSGVRRHGRGLPRWGGERVH